MSSLAVSSSLSISSSSPPLTLSLVSLNLAKRMDGFQHQFITQQKVSHDLYLFQEYCEVKTQFYDPSIYTCISTWALQRLWSRQSCGTAILIKHQIWTILEKQHYLTQDLETLIRTPKSITAVVIQHNMTGQHVLCISIHGWNGFPNHSDHKPLQRQLEQLNDILIKYSTIPTIFAGDFNTFSQSRIDTLFHFTSKHGLINYSSSTYRDNDHTRTLDYIFVRGMNITYSHTVRGLSDHRAIECRTTIMEENKQAIP